jgi:RNA polymerase sigma-70 factor (ECF subfamily)
MGALERPLATGTDRPLSASAAFGAYRAELIRHALHLTREPEEAAEIVQEAFLILIREERAGRGPSQVRAWLYRVVANLATSRARHRLVVARHAGAHPRREETDEPADASLARRDDAERLTRAMAGLSADARTALVLFAEGYSGREIAERIGRSDGATRTLLCRARSRVRARLGAPDPAALA